MKYVIAVSGGVDSVVLLDALVNKRFSELDPSHQLPTTNSQLIVAHFDHGIREDSAEDAQWVKGLAADCGLEYVSERAELGVDASEKTAREVRYNFLRRCCKKYNALLITAHHQDDVIETMLINLIRGTGWRGLAPMSPALELGSQTSEKQQTLRPLLDVGKAQILEYAKLHRVQWREDSTNCNQKYLRNYIRHTVLPAMTAQDPSVTTQLMAINKDMRRLKNEIATELQKILPTINYQLPTSTQLSRYFLIMAPPLVAQEVLYQIITQIDPIWHPNGQALRRVLHFIKTKPGGAVYQLSKAVSLRLTQRDVQFKKV